MDETLKAKKAHESFAKQHMIKKVDKYRVDNLIITDDACKEDCLGLD